MVLVVVVERQRIQGFLILPRTLGGWGWGWGSCVLIRLRINNCSCTSSKATDIKISQWYITYHESTITIIVENSMAGRYRILGEIWMIGRLCTFACFPGSILLCYFLCLRARHVSDSVEWNRYESYNICITCLKHCDSYSYHLLNNSVKLNCNVRAYNILRARIYILWPVISYFRVLLALIISYCCSCCNTEWLLLLLLLLLLFYIAFTS